MDEIKEPEEIAPRCRTLDALSAEVVRCRACPRLVAWREEVAREKRRAFQDEEYWGRPLPGFGDRRARLLIVGLAPAAHGGNRTGRIFTGDRSGDFLYASLHRLGLANQPTSVRRGDGLELSGVYIAAAVRCAPPANKPTPGEFQACRPWLAREAELLTQVRAVLALGRQAHDAWLSVLRLRVCEPIPGPSLTAEVRAARGASPRPYLVVRQGLATKPGEADRLSGDGSGIGSQTLRRAEFPFAHGAHHEPGGGRPALFASYHPSQQNTFTGKLTARMLDEVVRAAKERAWAR